MVGFRLNVTCCRPVSKSIAEAVVTACHAIGMMWKPDDPARASWSFDKRFYLRDCSHTSVAVLSGLTCHFSHFA